jgi:hypothetical protein
MNAAKTANGLGFLPRIANLLIESAKEIPKSRLIIPYEWRMPKGEAGTVFEAIYGKLPLQKFCEG